MLQQEDGVDIHFYTDICFETKAEFLLTIEPGDSDDFKESHQHQRDWRRVKIYDLEVVNSSLKEKKIPAFVKKFPLLQKNSIRNTHKNKASLTLVMFGMPKRYETTHTTNTSSSFLWNNLYKGPPKWSSRVVRTTSTDANCWQTKNAIKGL